MAACGASVATCPAAAQVIEPNGAQVPITPPGSTEQSVQDYFAARTPPEPIDAVKDASPEPGTFSPLCGFAAELVLSQSSAAAGLAWYDVPSDPSETPTTLHSIIAETTITGATITSAVIRGDPSYSGGLIGFALTKGGKPIYYSELSRNARCTQCSMPGNWKMMLAYASKLEPSTYYLAWEDWEGANESGWPDDGDFNDKLFRLTGVRCAGGGEPCDTGKPGACGRGLTACQTQGATECQQLVPEQREVCDAVDNDCNGAVDDGTLCPPSEICKRGSCVQACGSGEFVCPAGLVCDEGDCVEPACTGVRCELGKLCREGACVAPCDGVVCPIGQACVAGACIDPCERASCGADRVCRGGACVDRCDCAGCPSGLACDASSGQCVEAACAARDCGLGEVCVMGACKDACDGAKCPRSGACLNGRCQEPGQRALDGGTMPGRMGTIATQAPGVAGQTGGMGIAGERGASNAATRGAGCACRLTRAPGSEQPGRAFALVGALALNARRRRRFRKRRSWSRTGRQSS
jgi:hypothetical protein